MEPKKRIAAVTKLKNVPNACRECPFCRVRRKAPALGMGIRRFPS